MLNKEYRDSSRRLHRVDGPAREYTDGSKLWYLHGKRHRVDGPAREYTDGTEYWYHHGKLHRENGPAIEYANGVKFYYLNGVMLSEELFNKLTTGPVENLPLHLGKGFDVYISKRLAEEK